MLFADIDWTAVIQATGATVVIVIGAVFGWKIKLSSNEHTKAVELAKLNAQLEMDKRKEEARIAAEEETREEERQRREEVASDKREKNVVGELRRLLELSTQQRTEDRETLHDVRNELVNALHRIKQCETQREMQSKQLTAIFEHFDIRVEDSVEIPGQMIVKKGKKGSKEHRAINPPEDRQ